MPVPTIYSEQHQAHLHLGKLPAKPLNDAIAFKDAKRMFVKAGGTLPARPKHWGHADDFKAGPTATGGWGMLGNGPCDDGSIPESDAAFQGAGDCAWAGPAHEEMEAAKNAGRAVPRFTCLNVLQQYSAYSDYDLQTGANDNGSQISDVVTWRQTKGLVDVDGNVYKIGQAFEGTPGDLDELWEMSYLLEVAGCGFEIQQAQENQFNEGKPWSHVSGSPTVGGHYVCIPGLRLITWGAPKQFTASFYEQQNDEVVSYLDPLRYSAVTGKDAEGYDDQDVELFLTTLAQNQQQS